MKRLELVISDFSISISTYTHIALPVVMRIYVVICEEQKVVYFDVLINPYKG